MFASKQGLYWKLTASEVVAALQDGEVTPSVLLDQLEARVEAVDPQVNALPTRCFDRARQAAVGLEGRSIESRGLLAGLPVAIKDSIPVSGVRTTYGSRVFQDHVPDYSDILVRNLESNGAIVFAKSNTPEFEAGASTWNEVFGITSNPWDTDLSAGGSSGGAAASVASGMAWLAQGTDFACSLRNPASFCGVVGLRPSPGLVAQGPQASAFQTLSVAGPVARNVTDIALFLDAMSGASPQDPLSYPAPETPYSQAIEYFKDRYRVGFSPDLGITPIETGIADQCREFIYSLEHGGIRVEEAHPEMSGCHEAFRTLRALHFATFRGELLADYRDDMKPDVVWNIEEGMALSALQIMQAERLRARLCQNMAEFFQRYDFLVTPAAIVPPFPREQRYVEECAGHQFANYLEWMAMGYAITLVGCPAISIPCGFSSDGLPIGLQIVAPQKGEAQLLAFSRKIEKMARVNSGPIDPRAGSRH
jgi:amidase